MWKWLFDAHRLLGVTAAVIDDRLTVLTAPGSAGSVLQEDAEAATTVALRQAVTHSLATATPTMMTSGGQRLSCTPIVITGTVAGAVLVGADVERLGERELARAGALLASAIEDELSRTSPEQGGSLHKIAAFYQLLHSAIASGSDREVVRTFAEALSVWDEIEVFAYRADLDGRYMLEVSLPGSDLAANPREIDVSPFAIGAGLVRLTPHDREDMGFTGSGETALAHLAADGGPWLISMTAADDPTNAERSELYVAALAHAMNAALGVETSRLTWAVMQGFVDSRSLQDAAARALNETAAALKSEGGFSIFGPDGSPILVAGSPIPIAGDHLARGAAPADTVTGHTLRSHVTAPAPYGAILEMRVTGRVFTRRDVRLFEAAVATFATWLTSAIRRLSTELERRGEARSFDQLLDRYVRAANASRDATSLLLLSAHESPFSVQTAHSWIKRLRLQLRPTDLAGRLTSGEVGILLLQTPQPGAQVVARRLARMLQAFPRDSEPAVRIGVASQSGDALSGAALIERARAQGLTAPPESGESSLR
jgi:hypothetical protein